MLGLLGDSARHHERRGDHGPGRIEVHFPEPHTLEPQPPPSGPIRSASDNHFEMIETLADPCGLLSLSALDLMRLR